MTIRIGANPICWSNDDLPRIGGWISLEQCLSEARAFGIAGMELGHKFPRQPELLAGREGLPVVVGDHHEIEGLRSRPGPGQAVAQVVPVRGLETGVGAPQRLDVDGADEPAADDPGAEMVDGDGHAFTGSDASWRGNVESQHERGRK